mmetsp:Transcript_73700/g.196090  ORF Transcript_73700/g.196090 Transcript_73700/m.196090 type:complete len:457 (+) Transcript_73700:2487-3857(+)
MAVGGGRHQRRLAVLVALVDGRRHETPELANFECDFPSFRLQTGESLELADEERQVLAVRRAQRVTPPEPKAAVLAVLRPLVELGPRHSPHLQHLEHHLPERLVVDVVLRRPRHVLVEHLPTAPHDDGHEAVDRVLAVGGRVQPSLLRQGGSVLLEKRQQALLLLVLLLQPDLGVYLASSILEVGLNVPDQMVERRGVKPLLLLLELIKRQRFQVDVDNDVVGWHKTTTLGLLHVRLQGLLNERARDKQELVLVRVLREGLDRRAPVHRRGPEHEQLGRRVAVVDLGVPLQRHLLAQRGGHEGHLGEARAAVPVGFEELIRQLRVEAQAPVQLRAGLQRSHPRHLLHRGREHVDGGAELVGLELVVDGLGHSAQDAVVHAVHGAGVQVERDDLCLRQPSLLPQGYLHQVVNGHPAPPGPHAFSINGVVGGHEPPLGIRRRLDLGVGRQEWGLGTFP